jgi:hypothetical protein
VAQEKQSRNRRLFVVAQDPGVRRGGRVVTARVTIPFEDVEPGPVGHRVHVVDYDASTGTFYKPALLPDDGDRPPSGRTILGEPAFHAANVYALVMRTLARFEFALGRRVGWGFRAHQLKVVPHAFEAANAFYSPDDESLSFGYYRRGNDLVFTCLSHDIVVHETAHALLDGLRSRFMAPSSPDQAAFHEGYADIVALLSVFSLRPVCETLLDEVGKDATTRRQGLIRRDRLTPEELRGSVLLGLADDMEPELAGARVNALRRSVEIEPDPGLLSTEEFLEPHRRGELLVAAVMRAFVDVWTRRLGTLGTIQGDYLDRRRVAEEGADVADQLLTMVVRALDYTPPIHLRFGDFLSALLTADTEVREDDSRYHLRSTLLDWFGRYGVTPASREAGGVWERSDLQLARDGVRFGSLQADPTEMFRLVWANREQLQIDPSAFTRVSSVRPCLRIGPEDGLPVRETVAECIQYLSVPAGELSAYGLKRPKGMPDDENVVLEGGSTLILDEYGMLKYELFNGLFEGAQERIDYLFEQGYYDPGASFAVRLSNLHRRRALAGAAARGELW